MVFPHVLHSLLDLTLKPRGATRSIRAERHGPPAWPRGRPATSLARAELRGASRSGPRSRCSGQNHGPSRRRRLHRRARPPHRSSDPVYSWSGTGCRAYRLYRRQHWVSIVAQPASPHRGVQFDNGRAEVLGRSAELVHRHAFHSQPLGHLRGLPRIIPSTDNIEPAAKLTHITFDLVEIRLVCLASRRDGRRPPTPDRTDSVLLSRRPHSGSIVQRPCRWCGPSQDLWSETRAPWPRGRCDWQGSAQDDIPGFQSRPATAMCQSPPAKPGARTVPRRH
jgi:hypothetical protein